MTQTLSKDNRPTVENFRAELLKETLNHATLRVAGYQEKYASIDITQVTLDSISTLPICYKEEIKKAPEHFRDQSLKTYALQHTGGTSGNGLYLHRSSEEREFSYSFFSEVLRQELVENGTTNKILCLSFYGNFHGESMKLPFPGKVLEIDRHDNFWDFHTLLTEPEKLLDEDFDQIIISGFESQLRLFTTRLKNSKFNFSASKVTHLFCTGDFVSERLKRFYTNTWSSKFVNRYSMTEMVGGARSCLKCGNFHFEPHVIGEVVDLKSKTPVTSGFGGLVVTCLYPFIQKQPLIRFWTDDLVYKFPPQNNCLEFGFKFAGRRSSSLIDYEANPIKPFITGAELYDILDEYPDINRNTQFEETQNLKCYKSLGYLLFSLEEVKEKVERQVNLDIELRYPPYMYPQRVRNLHNEIKERLRTQFRHLREQEIGNAITFNLNFVGPGNLNVNMIAQIE